MTDFSQLEALLARLEGCEGADRSLDVDLQLAFVGAEFYRTDFVPTWEKVRAIRGLGAQSVIEEFCDEWEIPRLTSNTDAALALVEKFAPQYAGHWYLTKPGRAWEYEDGMTKGELVKPFGAHLHHMLSSGVMNSGVCESGFGATAALAICSALLRASLQLKEGASDK